MFVYIYEMSCSDAKLACVGFFMLSSELYKSKGCIAYKGKQLYIHLLESTVGAFKANFMDSNLPTDHSELCMTSPS